jgi:hypothetical protein
VSIDYYVRMERGNLAGASDVVPDGIASALQLDEAERAHLFNLARAALPVPPRHRRSKTSGVTDVIQQILDALTEAPAYTAAAGTPTADSLKMLASWAATAEQNGDLPADAWSAVRIRSPAPRSDRG